MSTETHVCLKVCEFGDDPSVVSSLLGIEPTIAWVKGDRYPNPNLKARRTYSCWMLESGLGKTEPLEAHLEGLLAKVEPLRAQIQQITGRFEVEVSVAQYFGEWNPGHQLDAPMLRRLAKLGLTIDFDLYCHRLAREDDEPRGASS